MPDIPLPPAPIPTDNALSGGTWVSGAGFDQASGTPVPYAEYRQWMTIDYTRNPHNSQHVSESIVRNLSVLSATNYRAVNTTRLHYNVTVHNSCTFLSGTYDLSASYQAQKFVVMANKFGKAGYSYGDVSGPSSLYVFGPQGSILTTQPYVRRKAKESSDFEYSFTQVGTTNGLDLSGWPTNKWGTGDEIGQDYSKYLLAGADIMGGTDYPFSNFVAGGADRFEMYGGEYATTSEPGYENNSAGLQRLIIFLEKVGASLNSTTFWWRFPVPTPIHSDGSPQVVEADRLAINPYYSTAFHDYS